MANSIGHLQDDIQETRPIYDRTEEIITEVKSNTKKAERDFLLRQRLGYLRGREVGQM